MGLIRFVFVGGFPPEFGGLPGDFSGDGPLWFMRQRQTSRGLPAEIAAILSLDPDVYFDLRSTSLPGIGQVLWQDAARTTPVEESGDPIGSALNLGSLGGFATSSGTERPLFEVGFDEIDDMLSYPLVQAQPFSVVAWVDPRGAGGGGKGRVYSRDNSNLRGGWITATEVVHHHGSPQDIAVPDILTRGQFRYLSIAAHAMDDSLLQAADGGGVIGSNDGLSGTIGFDANLRIGNRGNLARSFDGKISAFALFGRRISAIDIYSLPDANLVVPDPLPDDILAILSQGPDVYFDLRYPTLPGIGQVLWQDAARTTPVTQVGDPIGSALNLGSRGGFATSSGTQRPLWRGDEGAEYDGIDDTTTWDAPNSAVVEQPLTVIAHVEMLNTEAPTAVISDSTGSNNRGIVLQSHGTRDTWMAFAGELLSSDDSSTAEERRLTRLMVFSANGVNSNLRVYDTSRTLTDNFSGDAGTESSVNVRLGRRFNSQNWMSGFIKSWCRVPRLLSSEELESLPGVL